MAVVAIKLKVMPSSPEEDINRIQEELKAVLEKRNAKNLSFETEDIAFGLKALIIQFAWPEEQDTSELENLQIKGVSSIQIVDYRRAFG